MRRIVLPAVLLSCSVAHAVTPPVIPLSFEANRGQAATDVRYIARGTSQTIAFKDHEVLLPCAIGGRQVALELSGDPVRGEQPTGGLVNYYLGNDRSKWIEGLPLERRVRYSNVIPGVDLLFHGEAGALEYDLEIAPGADPSGFALRTSQGADLRIENDGSASVGASGAATGCERLQLLAPLAFQQIGGKRVEVKSSFRLKADGSLTVDVPSYDHTAPLTIDPVVSYTKIIGVNNTTTVAALQLDPQGNVVITGQTSANNYPVVSGGQQGLSSGIEQPYVTKLDPTGTQILFSTYLPAAGFNSTAALAVDTQGGAYIVGITGSSTFPVTSANLGTCTSFCNTGFAVKLSPTGSLVYSTLLGSGQQLPKAIAVDSTGSLYVAGLTSDPGLKTVNAFQSDYGAGLCTTCAGPFFGKLNPAGTDWLYSSYFSDGSSYPVETYATALTLDARGNLYIAGTGSAVPMLGSMQAGTGSSFVAEFGPDGHTLLWSSFLGGNSFGTSDYVNAIHVGADGTVYLAGSTVAQDFPYTVQAIRHPTYPAQSGNPNLYAEAINAAHTAFAWASYLGQGYVTSSAMDSAGNLYLGGTFGGGTLQFKNALAKDVASGSYIMELDTQGNLLNATAFGGRNTYQVPSGMAVDASGNIYIAGVPQDQVLSDGILDPINVGAATYADQKSLGQSTTFIAFSTFVAKIAPGSAPQVSLSYTQPAVELRNAGSADLHLSSIQGNASTPANNCNGTVAAGTACYIMPGSNTTITINSDANPSAQTYTLPTSPTAFQNLSLDTSQLNFPPAENGTTSATRPLVITNIGPSITISNILTFNGFSQTNNCVGTLAPLASCTAQIAVSPISTSSATIGDIGVVYNSGLRQDVFASFTQNTADGPLLLSVNQYGLQFGNVTLGTTSLVRTVTVTNSGTGPVAVGDPSITGTGASAFSVSSSTCSGATLQPQQNCTIGFVFTPSSTGWVTVPITLTSGGSTLTTELVGTGVAPVSLTMTPASLDFGNVPVGLSATLPVQLQNPTTSAISLTGINAALLGGDAAGDYSQQNNCGDSLSAGASCTITVTFAPTSLGARQGFASVLLNGGAGTQSSAITGTGVTLFNAAPSAVSLGNVPVGATATAQVTLTNASSSAQPFTLGQIAAPFTVGATSCASPLAPNATCSLTLAFTPSVMGVQTTSVNVTFANSSAPLTVAVSATGTAAIASFSAATFAFGSVVEGVASSTSLTLTNTGNAALTGLSLLISGANATDFTQTNTCGTALAAGANCTVALTFVPSTSSPESATLSLGGSMQNAPQSVPLTGTGTPPSFSVTASTPSVAVAAGSPANYSLAFHVDPGLTGQATLACSGLPVYATCSFSPATISLTSGGTATLSVSTSQTQVAGNWAPMATVSLCGLFLIPFARKRGRVALSFVVFSSMLGLAGCSGSSSATSNPVANHTPAGTYAFTVTATSGTTVKSTSLTLVVQ